MGTLQEEFTAALQVLEDLRDTDRANPNVRREVEKQYKSALTIGSETFGGPDQYSGSVTSYLKTVPFDSYVPEGKVLTLLEKAYQEALNDPSLGATFRNPDSFKSNSEEQALDPKWMVQARLPRFVTLPGPDGPGSSQEQGVQFLAPSEQAMNELAQRMQHALTDMQRQSGRTVS